MFDSSNGRNRSNFTTLETKAAKASPLRLLTFAIYKRPAQNSGALCPSHMWCSHQQQRICITEY